MFAYIDIDINERRRKRSLAAEFVFKTNLRYNFSSNDFRKLGGSELCRVENFYSNDHEFCNKGEIFLSKSGQQRIVMELFPSDCPIACENFIRICAGNEKDPFLTYKNCKVHRIVPGFVLQSGDIQFGNGSGGQSVFDKKKFKDERRGLDKEHNQRGILSMGNSGKNSNTSQFFMTLGPAPQLNGRHVIFGRVVAGFEVLNDLESMGTCTGEPDGSVVITDCGEWSEKHALCGYWVDMPDPDHYTGVSPTFVSCPRVGVVSPNDQVFEKFKNAFDEMHVVVVPFSFKSDSLIHFSAVLIAPSSKDQITLQDGKIITCKPAEARKHVLELLGPFQSIQMNE